MNTHKFWREIQQTKWHFWEERRVLPFVLHYYVQFTAVVLCYGAVVGTYIHLINNRAKARYTRCKFCIQENLNSSLCIHDARNVDEYTQVLAGDTTNKMAFLGGEEGAALCIAYACVGFGNSPFLFKRCAKMAGKEETPKCRKKTVTWTNEMIEDLIDFIEIHPIVAVYTIQVLHPSLHSRKLGSRKLEFKFVHTRCKKF
jgi:hypothetical protein